MLTAGDARLLTKGTRLRCIDNLGTRLVEGCVYEALGGNSGGQVILHLTGDQEQSAWHHARFAYAAPLRSRPKYDPDPELGMF